jgi:hypothetical protein
MYISLLQICIFIFLNASISLSLLVSVCHIPLLFFLLNFRIQTKMSTILGWNEYMDQVQNRAVEIRKKIVSCNVDECKDDHAAIGRKQTSLFTTR